MDDNPRALKPLLVVAAIAIAGSLATSYFFTQDSPPASPPAAPPTANDPVDPVQAPRSARSNGTDRGQEPGRPHLTEEERAAREQTIAIETDEFAATVTNLNTGLRSYRFKQAPYVNDDGSPMEFVSTDQERYLPLRFELGGVNIPSDAIWDAEPIPCAGGRTCGARFSWTGDGFTVVRKIEAGEGPYQLWSTVRVFNHGADPRPVRLKLSTYHYVPREDEEGGFFASRSPKISHGVCLRGEDVERFDRKTADSGIGMGPDIGFAGVENQYFASVLATSEGSAERCQVYSTDKFANDGDEDAHGSLFESRLIYPRTELEGRDSVVFRTLAYVGPKREAELMATGHHLPEVVDLGFFSMIARYLVMALRTVHGAVGNWGLAIILLTMVVRVLLFPLTFKSFQSMARMRTLKPQMDRLNELYKDDREKKGAALMELYRKEKINPLGGCFPQLVQLPVWFSFYASLSTNVELYHAGFALWWVDLSAPDPYFVLPLLLGGLMFLQQRLTPSTMDPMQAKIMMYMMPIMITSFMLFLPAGLCLYMVTNSVLGITQQHWIIRRIDKEKAAGTSADLGDAQMATATEGGVGGPDPRFRAKKPAKRKARRSR